MSEWMPIESAPKDGTRVRVGHNLDPYSMKPAADGVMYETTGIYDDSRWWCDAGFVCLDGMMRFTPTHWLPSPPEKEDSSHE